ncbi:MAG: N-acetylmannosamine-6-phosphate 2-epimerase [Capsulimonadaceae bacterium]|nr:N-acetylmannosamine-6-phosphate 2-epimerase [Capsulimonadaceae bacterium]
METNRFSVEHIIDQISGGLIVSCQALPDEPLHGSAIMARMAVAAQQGGARAIRANTPEDVAAIRDATTLPVIGLWKVVEPGYDVYITPRVAHAEALAKAGADVIALDATARPHPGGDVAEYIAAVRHATGLPVLADISTFDEGVAADLAGAEFVSTTMSGYTPYSPQLDGPDLELVRELAGRVRVLIAEGRIATPEQARAALVAGARAVIVGGAITRPQQIAARFAKALV